MVFGTRWPDRDSTGPFHNAAFHSALTWVGKVNALLTEMGEFAGVRFQKGVGGSRRNAPVHRRYPSGKNTNRTLSCAWKAERKAPLSSKGAFIPVGSAHDALIAISPVLNKAVKDILIIDPYLSQVVLNDFALSINEGVTLQAPFGQKENKPRFRTGPSCMAETTHNAPSRSETG